MRDREFAKSDFFSSPLSPRSKNSYYHHDHVMHSIVTQDIVTIFGLSFVIRIPAHTAFADWIRDNKNMTINRYADRLSKYAQTRRLGFVSIRITGNIDDENSRKVLKKARKNYHEARLEVRGREY